MRHLILLVVLAAVVCAQPVPRRPLPADDVIYSIERLADAYEKDGALVLIYRVYSNEAVPGLPAQPTSRAVKKTYRAIDGRVMLADIVEGAVIPPQAEKYEFPQ